MDKIKLLQEKILEICKEHGCNDEKLQQMVSHIEDQFTKDEENMGDIREWTDIKHAVNLYAVYDNLVNIFENKKLFNLLNARQHNYNFSLENELRYIPTVENTVRISVPDWLDSKSDLSFKQLLLIEKKTEKAVLVTDGLSTAWLPKSKIKISKGEK